METRLTKGATGSSCESHGCFEFEMDMGGKD